LLLDWQQEQEPGMGAAEEIDASAASGGRLIAVGQNGDVNGAIWSSGNGRDWSPSTLPPTLGYLSLYDASANGDGFIAVGDFDSNGNQGGVALVSPDGRSWQIAVNAGVPNGSFRNVATAGSEAVISVVGNAGFQWSHDTGMTWGFSNDASDVKVADGLLDMISTDSDIWAFSSALGTRLAPVEMLQWEGTSWVSVGTIPGSAGVDKLKAAHGPLGWLVLGSIATRRSEYTVGWYSVDGQTWEQIPNPPFTFSDIFADDSGFIVAGKWLPQPSGCALDPAEYAGLSWTSTDGLKWTRMADNGWQSKWIDQLRRYNRTLIGIGIDYSNPADFGVGGIWTASLPPIATNNGPVPSNPPSPSGGGCGP
jgi:hypothetical protein